jgi:hypothetical protein
MLQRKFGLIETQYKCASEGNARMHMSLKTQEAIQKIWTVLHHPLYSPSSTLSFSFIRSPEGCDLQYEV